jgi:PTH2 family peptidyl-tRNA hydrolase
MDDNDPLVMYLIVRESLNMGAGKVGAQCGHAVQLIMLEWMKLHKLALAESGLNEKEKIQYTKFNDWVDRKTNGSFRKVVLRAKDKEWEKIKNELDHVLVTDAGLTEVAAGSETVMALWPMKKSERPPMIKRLQIL